MGGQQPASPRASAAAGLSGRNLFWGKKSHRRGLGAQAANRTTLGSVPATAQGTGEELSPRGLLGGALPFGLLAAGVAERAQTLPVQLHPLQRAQRPLSAPALGRKGQGAASACEPHPPQWHKMRPSINPRGSGEQREGRAAIAPAQLQHP